MATCAVLYNMDLVRLILCDSSLDQLTLARAARVNRAISDVALDQLWYEIGRFQLVLHLLPLEPVEVEGHGVDEFLSTDPHQNTATELDMRDVITKEKWDRIYSYTRRIRALGLPSGLATLDGVCRPTVYSRLFERTSAVPMFPALKKLIWSGNSVNSELIKFVVQVIKEAIPRLGFLSLHDQGNAFLDMPDIARMLADVALSTTLKHIFVSTSAHTWWRVFSPLLSQDAAEPYRTVTSLCTKLCTTLSVRMETDWKTIQSTTLPCKLFSSLRSLSILYEHASDMALPFICAPSALVELEFSGRTPDTISLLDAFRDLGLRFPYLRILNIQCRITAMNGASIDVEDILQPLLDLRYLTYVELDFGDSYGPVDASFFLTNNDIRNMANAWSCLCSLTLRFDCEVGPSIYAFSAFAEHCSSLQSLTIDCSMLHDVARAFDGVDELSDLEERPWRSVRPLTSLRRLLIRWAGMWMADPVDVATFLVQTFPSVDMVEEYEDAEESGECAVELDFVQLWQSIWNARLWEKHAGEAVATY